jgi:hypothetical protein
MLASKLPEKTAYALIILRAATRLVEIFLSEPEKPTATVIDLGEV